MSTRKESPHGAAMLLFVCLGMWAIVATVVETNVHKLGEEIMARPSKASLEAKSLQEELNSAVTKLLNLESEHRVLQGQLARQTESYEKLIRNSGALSAENERMKKQISGLDESNRRLKSMIARARQERDVARGYISRVVEDDIVDECGPTTQTAPLTPMRGRPTAHVGTRREREMFGVDAGDEEFWNM